jgi:hypothetical protein
MAEAGTKPEVHVDPSADNRIRVLVVAAEQHVGDPLEQELRRLAGDRTPEIKIVAPALASSKFEHAAGAVDQGIAEARERLEEAESDIEQHEPLRDAQVAEMLGDADPLLAIEDALADFPADEILLVTHEEGEGRWLEDGIFDRVRKGFDVPVRHFEVAAGGSAKETEHSDGADPADRAQMPRWSGNMPKFSVREGIGILVALVGTIVLVVLASSGQDFAAQTDFGAFHITDHVARIIIAGVMALINIGNVVGLVLFASVGYRGPWERFFAHISLWGTLIAIPVVLLLF